MYLPEGSSARIVALAAVLRLFEGGDETSASAGTRVPADAEIVGEGAEIVVMRIDSNGRHVARALSDRCVRGRQVIYTRRERIDTFVDALARLQPLSLACHGCAPVTSTSPPAVR